ncbi:cell division cycle-associated protein 3-like [Arapaima gigas]
MNSLADPWVRHERLSRLADPRSPSVGIDRTPIQVGAAVQASAEAECEGPMSTIDPRSPSPGISRTPLKEVMRATVNSFARRLNVLFLNDGADKVNNLPPVSYTKTPHLNSDEKGNVGVTQPLLPVQPSLDSAIDALSPPESDTPRSGSLSKAEQVEVEVGVEACQFLEEDEDNDLPLNVGLSSSLLTCRDGVVLSQDLSDDAPLSISPPQHTGIHGDLVSEAPPSVTPDPREPLNSDLSFFPVADPSDLLQSPAGEAEPSAQPVTKPEELPVKVDSDPPPSQPQPLGIQSGSEQNRIRLLTFDPRSPSQVVFKPQWLGVGFGTTGVRARGVQGRGKGGSSPLSVRGGNSVGNENKGHLAKHKQRERCGKVLASECRSPLQVLKETNSPRDHSSQMKVKLFTPDRLRIHQADRRVLALSLDKENQ